MELYVIALCIAWLVALTVLIRLAWLFLHRKRTRDPQPSYAIGLDITLRGGKTYYTVIDTTSPVYRVVDQGEVERLTITELVADWAVDLALHYNGIVEFYIESNGNGSSVAEYMERTGLRVRPIFVTHSNKAHMTHVLNEALRSGYLEGYPWAEDDRDMSRRLAYYGVYGRHMNILEGKVPQVQFA